MKLVDTPRAVSDRNICYHFMIGKDGKTIQNRQPIARTGCTRNQEVNLSAISIVLAGDFDVEEPTEEQLTSLRALVKELDSTYHFKAIVGHRDASPSSCPGKYLSTRSKTFCEEASRHRISSLPPSSLQSPKEVKTSGSGQSLGTTHPSRIRIGTIAQSAMTNF